MTNSLRGEVSLGDHTLRFSVNALVELEEAMGQSVAEIAQYMGSGSVRMKDVRTIIWIGLRGRNPDLKEAEAGDIASEVGIPAALEAVGRAFSLAFPSEEGEASPAIGSRPPKRGSTGSGSSPASRKQA
ncbi:MAG: gene transfer agent family protein [Beijerinckiaceae bacterium]|nr:gene transfer agent family protein [Beijerinckiaceae bacterium]